MQKIFCFVLLVFASIFSLKAQDANYWSSSYSAGGFFTPGAVIARNNDNGVLFLNPALLAYSKLNVINVTGTLYQLDRYRFQDALGKGLPLKSSSTIVNPLIASNSLTLKTKKFPITFFYALINTPVIDFAASQRKDSRMQVLEDSYSPGNEVFIGQYSYQNKVTETGFVLSTGMPVSDKLAIGVSLEGTIRKQFLRQDFAARSLVNAGVDSIFPPVVNATETYENSNRTTNGRMRIGLSYTATTNHHFGLLISSPLVRVLGNATLLSDVTINNVMLSGVNFRLLASTRQEKLKARWKMPVSIAAGYSYHHAKGQLYASVEYFAKVKDYDVVSPRADVFIRPDTTSTGTALDLLRLTDGRKAVVNASLGTSHNIRENFVGYFSIRTDFTYANQKHQEDGEGFKVNTTAWNNYHCQVGANIKKKRFNLRMGLNFTYGRTNSYPQPMNFDSPNEANLLQGELGNTKATHFLMGALVSYIHHL